MTGKRLTQRDCTRELFANLGVGRIKVDAAHTQAERDGNSAVLVDRAHYGARPACAGLQGQEQVRTAC